MDFKQPLDPQTQLRVQTCDTHLYSPTRLEALSRTGLMGTAKEEVFDRIAELAARILKVPLTIISLVSDQKQFFKAGFGLPAPYDEVREIPVDSSICRYTLAGQTIIAGDASVDALLMHHPTTEPWGIAAFIAIPMITKDGHVLGAFCAVDTEKRPWTDDDVYIMRELTASVMTEIDLRMQVADLEVQRDLREQFVATLTHDLRTPLGVARMSAQILSSEDGDGLEKQKFARMVSDNLDRADQMIRDLLDASFIKAGEKVHLELEACDLNKIADATVEGLSSIHGPRFAICSNENIQGIWDRKAIRRMIENLASNAVKYGASETKIEVRLGIEKDFVRIAVHNHGNPIERENLSTLFEPFRRTKSAQNSSQKGWGIGLTLVRGFAEAHGGSVYAESSEQDGTTFTIRLPLKAI